MATRTSPGGRRRVLAVRSVRPRPNQIDIAQVRRGCGPVLQLLRHARQEVDRSEHDRLSDVAARAHRQFVPPPKALLAEPEPTRVRGIDETRRGKPRWTRCELTRRWVRVDPWDTGFVDLSGSQGLLGQREGRTGAAVIDWLRERTPQFRDAIEFVAIDPAAVYASAIRTPGLLPNAQIVADHFHL